LDESLANQIDSDTNPKFQSSKVPNKQKIKVPQKPQKESSEAQAIQKIKVWRAASFVLSVRTSPGFVPDSCTISS
jgi:hypothetical protein